MELIVYGFILYGPEGQLAWKVGADCSYVPTISVRRYGVTPDDDVCVRVRVWQPPPNVERPSVVVSVVWGPERNLAAWYMTFRGRHRTIAHSDLWPPNGPLSIVWYTGGPAK